MEQHNHPPSNINSAAPVVEPTLAARYKTALCRNIAQGKKCRYGRWCKFAHSENEVRQPPPAPNTQTQPLQGQNAAPIAPHHGGGNWPLPGNPARQREVAPLSSPLVGTSSSSSMTVSFTSRETGYLPPPLPLHPPPYDSPKKQELRSTSPQDFRGSRIILGTSRAGASLPPRAKASQQQQQQQQPPSASTTQGGNYFSNTMRPFVPSQREEEEKKKLSSVCEMPEEDK